MRGVSRCVHRDLSHVRVQNSRHPSASPNMWRQANTTDARACRHSDTNTPNHVCLGAPCCRRPAGGSSSARVGDRVRCPTLWVARPATARLRFLHDEGHAADSTCSRRHTGCKPISALEASRWSAFAHVASRYGDASPTPTTASSSFWRRCVRQQERSPHQRRAAVEADLLAGHEPRFVGE
jgi:hypothetical protein